MLRPLLGRRLGLMSVRFLSSGPLKIRELVSEHTAKEIEADSEGKLRAKPFPRHFPTLKDLSPWKWVLSRASTILLPAGYPDSVKPEYLRYQLWLSLQSMVGSASYVLSMHALLASVGVGAETSLPVAAATAWILKDGIGNVGVILFAGKIGSRVDKYPKTSKFAADILHCVGVGTEILTPLAPSHFLILASMANLTKGIAGVLSGASRATFNKHLCEGENMGDLTAKGQAQGTTAYLLGLGLGLWTSTFATSLPLAFGAYSAFTLVYLTCSWNAVRTVALRTVNAERLHLLLEQWHARQPLATPELLRRKERLFRSSQPGLVFGSSVTQAFSSVHDLEAALGLGKDKEYLIGEQSGTVFVVLRADATPGGLFEAYFVAFARRQKIPLAQDSFTQFRKELAHQGWNQVLLEAPSAPRAIW